MIGLRFHLQWISRLLRLDRRVHRVGTCVTRDDKTNEICRHSVEYHSTCSVLMAFSVLLVKDLQTGSTSIIGVNFFVSAFISLLTFFVLLFVIFSTDWQTVDKLNEPKIKAALFEEYSLNENKNITIVLKETPPKEIHNGVYNNSIIPIGTLLTTKYFISLQLIGLIIVSCVIGSIAITKNTIENDDEMEELL